MCLESKYIYTNIQPEVICLLNNGINIEMAWKHNDAMFYIP